MDFQRKAPEMSFSIPGFIPQAAVLMEFLKQQTSEQLAQGLGISPALAKTNQLRFQQWSKDHNLDNAKPAIFAYQGDVYQGLNVWDFSLEDILFAQRHLRIISGLYGLLRPLDLIKPYRLEMGSATGWPELRNLYLFWDKLVTKAIFADLDQTEPACIIHLASHEYFRVFKPKTRKVEIIQPSFLEYRNGKYISISFFAKKARGMMSSFLIKNRISDPEQLKSFDLDGYHFNAKRSLGLQWVFTRNES